METFKEFYSSNTTTVEENPDTEIRSPVPELGRRESKMKAAQLINLVDGIQSAVDKVQADLQQTEFSPEEVALLHKRIATLARDLEGTRLPPEAEGKAAAGYSALSKLNFPESVQPLVSEALELLKDIISA